MVDKFNLGRYSCITIIILLSFLSLFLSLLSKKYSYFLLFNLSTEPISQPITDVEAENTSTEDYIFSLIPEKKAKIVFSEISLSAYDGSQSSDIYVCIVGQVFDVSAAKNHYGLGGPYNIFAGRDSSRSFITGIFSLEASSSELLDIEEERLVQLKEWLSFYWRKYNFIGVLHGRYYDSSGNASHELLALEEKFQRSLRMDKERNEEEVKFPSCNTSWTAEKGGFVFCSTSSGGIHRSWSGRPRQKYDPVTGHHRCVCVRDAHLSLPELRTLPGCSHDSSVCKIS